MTTQFMAKNAPLQTPIRPQPRPVSVERPRVQLDFTPEAFEHLNIMKARANAKSNADLARNALRLYEWYLDRRDQGYELLLAKEGEVKQVELLL